ncbi:hypothetical protein scyTo_0021375, partial [Scyliorhinus torazame]|nr:hypothetical protein [Scyliorhinus torazame]
IENIANYVLSIKIPITPEEVKNKSKQIQDILSEIKDLDKALEKLNRHSEEAKILLKRAIKAENATQRIPSPKQLKKDLDDIKEVQKNVKDTVQKITDNLNDVQTKISQAGRKIESCFDKLMDLMNSVTKLQNEVEELENKISNNKKVSGMVMKKASEAKTQAEEAEQENTNNQQFLMRNPRTTDLEKKIQDGNKKIMEKTDYLSSLEQNVTAIKTEIEEKVSYYTDCQS